MSQISPKQIDWSQSISGSLLPYTSGSSTISDFTLGDVSSSWGGVFVNNAEISGNLSAQTSEFDTILVRQRSDLRGITVLSGSVIISGSLDVHGSANFEAKEPNQPTVTVGGQLEIVNQEISSSIQRARITIQNLGEIGNRQSNLILDLGGFF